MKTRIDELEKRVAVLEAHIHRCIHGCDIRFTYAHTTYPELTKLTPVRDSTTACPPVLIPKETP